MRRGCDLQLLDLSLGRGRTGRIDHECKAPGGRNEFVQQLQALGRNLDVEIGDAREIAAR